MLGTVTLAGFGYLAWALSQHGNNDNFSPCLFKNVTGIACPSCGSTRSVISIIKGNVGDAAYINPLGFVIAALMLLIPVWLAYDIVLGKDSLYRSYGRFEKTMQVKWIAIVLIILIIANWIWNITKGL